MDNFNNSGRPPQEEEDKLTRILQIVILVLLVVIVLLLAFIGGMYFMKNKKSGDEPTSAPVKKTENSSIQQTTQVETEVNSDVPQTEPFSVPEKEAPSWQEAYAQTLRDYCKKDLYHKEDGSGKYSMYEITDVNGDDIPELFISSGREHFDVCDVYTFSGRSASPVIRFQGYYGKLDVFPEDGIIRAYDKSEDFEWSDFYTFDGKKLSLIESIKNSWNAQGEHSYMHNNYIIPGEQYDQIISAYNGKQVLLGVGRLYPFGEDITKEQVSFSAAEGAAVHVSTVMQITPAE